MLICWKQKTWSTRERTLECFRLWALGSTVSSDGLVLLNHAPARETDHCLPHNRRISAARRSIGLDILLMPRNRFLRLKKFV